MFGIRGKGFYDSNLMVHLVLKLVETAEYSTDFALDPL